jgi:hypothetical protein
MTQELLKSILHYDKDTGVFTWKIQSNSNNKIGDIAGTKKQSGYMSITYKGKLYSSHRLAFLYEHGYLPKIIDHINRIKTDNRIENLREATHSQNQYNSKKGFGKSHEKNVYWRQYRQKWAVIFYFNNKPKQFGSFKTIEEATKLAQKLRIQFHGDFAYHKENT